MEEGLFAGSETGVGGGGGYVGYLTWLRYVSEKAWVWRRVSLLVVRLGGGGGGGVCGVSYLAEKCV